MIPIGRRYSNIGQTPKAVVRDKKAGNAYSAAGDDDINDVAAMGGVNLAEEANRILGATDNVGTVVRSCKDETFLQTGLLHQRITRICKEKVGCHELVFAGGFSETGHMTILFLGFGSRARKRRCFHHGNQVKTLFSDLFCLLLRLGSN